MFVGHAVGVERLVTGGVVDGASGAVSAWGVFGCCNLAARADSASG